MGDAGAAPAELVRATVRQIPDGEITVSDIDWAIGVDRLAGEAETCSATMTCWKPSRVSARR